MYYSRQTFWHTSIPFGRNSNRLLDGEKGVLSIPIKSVGISQIGQNTRLIL